MRCPKCGFTSFPYLDSCGKCGQGLAEQRSALGLYALRPDPPDLRLAYQMAPTDLEASEVGVAPPSTDLDLGALEEIRLDLAEVEEAPSTPQPGREAVEAAADLLPPPAFEPPPAPVPLADSEARQTPAHETEPAPIFDLNELGDITLELETAADLEDAADASPPPPMAAPGEQAVYDLDLEDDTGELVLGPEVAEDKPVDAGQGTVEYTLEIDDDIELEFEIEELDAEGDGEMTSEEEDDDER